MNIYIIRHGETEWNIVKKWQGHKNSNLTELGKLQAEKLANKLKNIKFNKIYSSPLGRAYDTAKILKGNRDIDIELDNRLKEINMGVLEGLDREIGIKKYGNTIEQFWNYPHLYNHKEINGESFYSLNNRTKEFLEEIIKKYNKNEHIVIVSHGVTIKSFLFNIKNKNIKEFWDGGHVKNTALTHIYFDNEFKIIKYLDNSHLQ
ncbi:phosphoglycerate mutase [Hypnocyclicus thermotrophus]|uniref:Phosphoglycerate mutase n=1 Tax=Hypnocyclicus thermotrophus TaxID=1627895 RepID=A0AA46I6K9_9FUSO|nr:histidine phosphatase family protein [Hypnocyclicus thermotrophus]TDT72550.1 phosphoglycerate mutase [Hypnocyclicus thermotrophus]